MELLLFLAKGFETMEFSPFVDIFGWARNDFGYEIEVVTCGFTKQVVSSFNIPIIVDTLIDDIDVSTYDALAIPGGFQEFGFYEEVYEEKFLQLIREFNKNKKPIASICTGAMPIGKSGVLTGRKGTTYHLKDGYRQQELKAFGVDIVNEPIVIDDNIITSYCPQTAAEVGFILLEKLTSPEKMQIVKKAMGYA